MDFYSGCLTERSPGSSTRGCQDDFSSTIKLEQILFSIVPATFFIASCLWRIFGSVRRPASSGSLRPSIKSVSYQTIILSRQYEAHGLRGVIGCGLYICYHSTGAACPEYHQSGELRRLFCLILGLHICGCSLYRCCIALGVFMVTIAVIFHHHVPCS